METTTINNPLDSAMPATSNKKTWANPTLEIVSRGYVEGGNLPGLNEATVFSPKSFGTIS